MRLFPISLVIAPLLAACMADQPATAPAKDCRAGSYAELIGAPLNAFNADQAAGPVRILPPGAAMTMDHNPNRLNIHHDSGKRITQITCG